MKNWLYDESHYVGVVYSQKGNGNIYDEHSSANFAITYSLKEVAYSDLTTLMNEATEAEDFLALKADEQPFLLVFPQLFEGHPDYHLFVLLEHHVQQLGFIATLPHEEENALSMGPMYISKRYRGRGLGKRLVYELIQWSQAHGVRRLFTQTWGGNAASRRIFEGLGFEYIGKELDTRVNGDSTVRYFLDNRRI